MRNILIIISFLFLFSCKSALITTNIREKPKNYSYFYNKSYWYTPYMYNSRNYYSNYEYYKIYSRQYVKPTKIKPVYNTRTRSSIPRSRSTTNTRQYQRQSSKRTNTQR